MERSIYYPIERERELFFFKALLPTPTGVQEILDVQGRVQSFHPLSTKKGVQLTIEVLFSYRVLLGPEDVYRAEELKTFYGHLLGETSLDKYFFSLELEIGALYVESINRKGLITSLGVEVEIKAKKKNLREAPIMIQERFLLKGVEREVQREVFLEKEIQRRRDWIKITDIAVMIKDCQATIHRDSLLVSMEIELGIYYLDPEEILFLIYEDHLFYTLIDVEGIFKRENVEAKAYVREVSWKEGSGTLYVQLILSLHLSFSAIYPEDLPIIQQEEGFKLYLKAILEEGEKGFLLEREIALKEGSPLKVKNILSDFTIHERRRIHKAIFFNGLVEVLISYLNYEGDLIWESFSLSYQGEIPCTISKGEVDLVISMGELVWDSSPYGLSLIIPLQVEYYLTREGPYHLLLDHDGLEIEALEYLGKREKILLLSSYCSSPKHLRVIEKIEANLRIERVLSLSGHIYLEGIVEYQIYYLTPSKDEERYFSFQETFAREYVMEGIRRDSILKPTLTLEELEYQIVSSKGELKVISFWEIEFILCREGRFSVSQGEEDREGLLLEKKGEKRKRITHYFKDRDLSIDLKTIEGVEVEILLLETLGSRVLFEYKYLFCTTEASLVSSTHFFSEILLPLKSGLEDLLLVEGRVLWVAYSIERDHLQTSFLFHIDYQHFTRDE